MKTNREVAQWARRYEDALRLHLTQGQGVNLESAARLGQAAVVMGLETLDLAQIHKKALGNVALPEGTSRDRQRMIDQAKRFFTETIVPIEKTHNAAIKDVVRVNQLAKMLHRRTVESSVSSQHLKRGIARRQAAEVALRKSGKHHIRLLQESGRLKKSLRDKTRKILSDQETKRRMTSRKLYNEIAQSLLAINIRLLAVNRLTRSNSERFKKEIAETQSLVNDSAKRINRLANEFINQH